jgi:hypothetical protein
MFDQIKKMKSYATTTSDAIQLLEIVFKVLIVEHKQRIPKKP